MLITRLCDTSYHSHWVFNNHNWPPLLSSTSRMSDKQILPLPVEPDRPEHYSYSSSAENKTSLATFTDTRGYGQAALTPDQYRHALQSRSFIDRDSHQHATPKTMHCSPHDNNDSPSTLDASCTIAKGQTQARGLSPKAGQFRFLRLSESSSIYLTSPSGKASSAGLSACGKDDKNQRSMSHEADDEIEDEDGGDSEGEVQSRGQSVAERLAARQKMKRFRYFGIGSHDK